MAEYKIDVMGIGIVPVEADNFEQAKELAESSDVKVQYQRYVHEWFTGRIIDKEEPRKIELSWKLRGWICLTCHWGTSFDKKRCNYCGQRLLTPYE